MIIHIQHVFHLIRSFCNECFLTFFNIWSMSKYILSCSDSHLGFLIDTKHIHFFSKFIQGTFQKIAFIFKDGRKAVYINFSIGCCVTLCICLVASIWIIYQYKYMYTMYISCRGTSKECSIQVCFQMVQSF